MRNLAGGDFIVQKVVLVMWDQFGSTGANPTKFYVLNIWLFLDWATARLS